ncbi:ead/Ea22-like family protein [Escherichia coli]|uniref:ead/Ea22-like family protein n=1 Tax=Escherichia coli TaxID=562 RepID=UPI001FF1D297|nr:ead/Ea22-like family protein [Escherichia coli]
MSKIDYQALRERYSPKPVPECSVCGEEMSIQRIQVNFLYEPSERPYCHHASVRVDEKERQIRCKICGAVVESFDWMLSVAKRETRLADDVRLLRQEEQERRKNIEKLIQIERNAKARIRRVTKSRTE